jgi:hypothetical protein
VRPGTDALVEVEAADGSRVGLLVLDAATARTVYRGRAWGRERLVLCGDGVVFDEHRGEVRLHSPAAQPSFAVLPAPDGALVEGARVREAADGVFTRYTVEAGRPAGTAATVTSVRPGGPAPGPVTGVQGRASVPAEKDAAAAAAEYRVDVPEDLLRSPSGVLLRLRWTGDLARAYVGDVLVADQFYSGRVWDIGLDRLPVEALRTEGLRLKVLPLAPDAPVHVPGRPGGAWREAHVRDAEWVVTRRWTVRAG